MKTAFDTMVDKFREEFDDIANANRQAAGLPTRNELSKPSTEEMEQAALRRALENKSSANYATITREFVERGIPESEIIPRENVFTYKAWRAKEEPMSALLPGPRRSTTFQATGLQDDKLFAPKNEALADKLEDEAGRVAREADLMSQPMTSTATPKRLQQHTWKLHKAAELTVVEIALRCLAELNRHGKCPKPLGGVRTSGQVEKLVSLKFNSRQNGFYQIYDTTGEYSNNEPKAVLLQQIIGYVRETLKPTAPGQAVISGELHKAQVAARDRELAMRGIPGFFPTPQTLADIVVEIAEIEDGHEVLEPSAGIGSLAEMVRLKCPAAKITCIEYERVLAEQCQAKGFDTYHGDCMQADGEFDRIVMNPPFEHNEYIRQVMHCYTMLRPGGILVAVAPTGYTVNSKRTAVEFRDWLDQVKATTPRRNGAYFNCPDSLRKTSVEVNVIRIEKPIDVGSLIRHELV